MFFEKFVEQHRVHRFVAHGEDFPFGVAHHQTGIHLLYLLSHKAKLGRAFRVDVLFVMEGNRPQRKERFARVAHRFDPIFEALGRAYEAKLTTGSIDIDGRACDRCVRDARDKGGRLDSTCADANGAGLTGDTLVPYIDIVVARGEITTGEIAQRNVAIAGCVDIERTNTAGRVPAAGCIVVERGNADGRVKIAGGVEKERKSTVGGVLGACCVATERSKAAGRVIHANGVARERYIPDGRVVGARCVATERSSTDCRVMLTSGVATERSTTVGRVKVAGGVAVKRSIPVGCVGQAGGVAIERSMTVGRVIQSSAVARKRFISASCVLGAGCVAKQRVITKGRVMHTAGKALECTITIGRVGAGIASVRFRTNPQSLRGWRQREHENCEE